MKAIKPLSATLDSRVRSETLNALLARIGEEVRVFRYPGTTFFTFVGGDSVRWARSGGRPLRVAKASDLTVSEWLRQIASRREPFSPKAYLTEAERLFTLAIPHLSN